MILTDAAGVVPAKGKSVPILSPGFLRDLGGPLCVLCGEKLLTAKFAKGSLRAQRKHSASLQPAGLNQCALEEILFTLANGQYEGTISLLLFEVKN
jgi:hypothetical protein